MLSQRPEGKLNWWAGRALVLGNNICKKGKGKEHRPWSSVSDPAAGYHKFS